MRLRAESIDPASVQADVLAVPIYREDKEISGTSPRWMPPPAARSAEAIEWGEFNILEHYTALVDGGSIAADKVLLINGVRRGRGAWRARRIASTATRRLQGRGRGAHGPLAARRRGGRCVHAAPRIGRAAGHLPAVRLLRARARHAGHAAQRRGGGADRRRRASVEVVEAGAGHGGGRRVRPRPGQPRRRTTSTRSAWPRSPASWRPMAARSRCSTSTDMQRLGMGAPAGRRAGRRPRAAPDRHQAPRLGEGRRRPAPGDRRQGRLLRLRRHQPQAAPSGWRR